MSNVCKCCSHKDRLEIDKALISGRTMVSISKEYGMSEAAILNHRDNHISRQLVQAYALKTQEQGFDLLHKIDTILSKAETIFTRNYELKKDTLALKALSEQRFTIELLAKISFSLHQAKLTELEQSREKRQEAEQGKATSNAEWFVNQLEILSPEEQVIWKKLYKKIIHQKKSFRCLPDAMYETPPSPRVYNSQLQREYEAGEQPEHPEPEPEPLQEQPQEQPQEQNNDLSLQVKPLTIFDIPEPKKVKRRF